MQHGEMQNRFEYLSDEETETKENGHDARAGTSTENRSIQQESFTGGNTQDIQSEARGGNISNPNG